MYCKPGLVFKMCQMVSEECYLNGVNLTFSRERDKKGGWWGWQGRGQCQMFKILSVVQNRASALYELN